MTHNILSNNIALTKKCVYIISHQHSLTRINNIGIRFFEFYFIRIRNFMMYAYLTRIEHKFTILYTYKLKQEHNFPAFLTSCVLFANKQYRVIMIQRLKNI